MREFRDFRRLLCLPLVPQLKEKDLRKDPKSSIDKFWGQGVYQLADLEGMGKVSNIFLSQLPKMENQVWRL